MLTRLDLRGTTGDPTSLLPAPEAGGRGPVEAVASIIEQVREGGDTAVRALTAEFDGAQLDDLIVDPDAAQAALARIAPDLRAALELAADRVEAFHRHQLAETAHPATFTDAVGVTVRTEFRAVAPRRLLRAGWARAPTPARCCTPPSPPGSRASTRSCSACRRSATAPCPT